VRARAAVTLLFVVLVAPILGSASRDPIATAAPGEAPPHFVPELGLPALGVVAFGASPAGDSGDAGATWAYGRFGKIPPPGAPSQANRFTLLRRDATGGWQAWPLPGEDGTAPATGLPAALGALAGQTTPAGAVALMTAAGIVLRDPGGPPTLAPPPPAEVLFAGESLPPAAAPEGAPTPYAVIDEDGGHAGIFIAPYGDGSGARTPTGRPSPGVLHYDGSGWTREPIEALEEVTVAPLAIGCGPTDEAPAVDSSRNCWLLARAGHDGSAAPALYRREAAGEGGGPAWVPIEVSGGLLGDEAAALSPLPAGAQMLTVTAQGAWVDFSARLGGDDGEPSSATELVEPVDSDTPDAPRASVAGGWCFPTGPGCEESLGAALPAAYRSFAWPATTPSDPGARVITGLPGRALLKLAEGAFAYAVGPGGSNGSAPGAAAFASPDEGLIADGTDPNAARDGAGQSQAFALTTEPVPPRAAVEPVPFTRPLLGLVMAPGSAPGDPRAEAIAVGRGGEVAHFIPGIGWRQDPVEVEGGLALEHAPGTSAEIGSAYGSGPLPTLRAVAWPTPEAAYAVGDGGAIWDWSPANPVWIPDPGTHGGTANLNGIAFSTTDPARGFAVGDEQLLSHGAGWNYSPPPLELSTAHGAIDYTSVAFAGDEALATYRVPDAVGGAIVEAGGGWRVDDEVAELLAQLPLSVDEGPNRVAGLPDGGAVIAGPGYVLKRERPGEKWQLAAAPLPEVRSIAALAAYRDSSGRVRAMVSVGLGPYHPKPPVSGTNVPESIPASGYLLRETDGGWRDVENEALPVRSGAADLPRRPEPVQALVVGDEGSRWLAVGGKSGDFTGEVGEGASEYETAAALRFPPEGAVVPDQEAPVATPSPSPAAALVAGGGAACAAPCANQAEGGMGPDALLAGALARTTHGEVEGTLPLPFVYSGGRLESGVGEPGCERELRRLAAIFGASGRGGILTAASPDLSFLGPASFAAAFAGYGPAATGPAYYSYRAVIPGGRTARIVVLDLSSGALGSEQEAWLRTELADASAAGEPSVAVGDASLGFELPDPPAAVGGPAMATDGEAIAAILVEGGAAAYFYDYPGAIVASQLTVGAKTIPAIGSGALGYGRPAAGAEDWLGSSATVEAQVHLAGESEGRTAVTVAAIPNIAGLMLYTHAGPRLAAGDAVMFEALGRVPAGGIRVDEVNGAPSFSGPEPYVRMPFPSASLNCGGANCQFQVPLEYSFASSDPQVGDFVMPGGERNSEGRLPSNPRSAFFCAKSPGTTTVSVSAGGLSYSEPVEVTEGESGESCRPPVPLLNAQGTPVVEPPSVDPAEPPPPATHRPVPHPHPTPGQAPTPTPALAHSPPATQVPPAHQSPPPAPTPGTPIPQALSPVVSPHPPPGVEPAPPTGVSPQPAVQPSPLPVGQIANAPAPGVAPAPGLVPSQAGEDEAAIQRQHLAVRAPRAAAPVRGGAMALARSTASGSGGALGGSTASGSDTAPLAGAMGIVALLALAGAAGISVARRDRGAYARAPSGPVVEGARARGRSRL